MLVKQSESAEQSEVFEQSRSKNNLVVKNNQSSTRAEWKRARQPAYDCVST